jgi:hypothetical protein
VVLVEAVAQVVAPMEMAALVILLALLLLVAMAHLLLRTKVLLVVMVAILVQMQIMLAAAAVVLAALEVLALLLLVVLVAMDKHLLLQAHPSHTLVEVVGLHISHLGQKGPVAQVVVEMVLEIVHKPLQEQQILAVAVAGQKATLGLVHRVLAAPAL